MSKQIDILSTFSHSEWKIRDVKVDNYIEKTDNNSEKNIVFSVDDKKKKMFIGTTGLYLINWVARRAQFRILLGNYKDSNKGIGTDTTKLVIEYGFKRLNLEMIYLGVNVENIQALRVYKNAGLWATPSCFSLVFLITLIFDMFFLKFLLSSFSSNKIS